jgi:hypothetical protein
MPHDPNILNWVDATPLSIKEELESRFEEMTRLEQEQIQVGTTTPQLYGSLSRFVANPSTVSVETYKRMLDTDETLGSCMDFMLLAMIARFGDYKHKVPEIQDFVRKALDNMEGSWHENLMEMLTCEWAGFSVTEQVFKVEKDFDGAFAFVPRKLVTYPPLTIVFAVDMKGDLLPHGIYQYQRYHNTYFNGYGLGSIPAAQNGFRPDLYAAIGDYPYPVRIAADLSYLTVRIPVDKCIHLKSSSTGNFNNPYGRSILRRIYKNWALKDAFLKMWVVGADRKGTPLIVGYAAPNDTVQQQTDTRQDGQGAVDANRADRAMANVFKTIHSSSFVVLPGKKGETYEVEAVQVQGDMNVFKDGVDYFNKAFMKGMLIPPLVMTGGDGAGSYSLGAEHNKIFRQLIDGKLKPYQQAIITQFISKIVRYNFPEQMWRSHGYGEFVLEEFDAEVMEKLGNIYGSLTTSGYMSPSDQVDMDHVRQKLNLKEKAATAPLGGLDPNIDPLDNLPDLIP